MAALRTNDSQKSKHIYTETIATSPNPLIFLSAGEASGDAYGAAIIAGLRRHLPTSRFTGLGGTAMEAAGQQRIVRAEDVAHMGITEVLRHAPFIYAQYQKLVAAIRADRPALAVLIDFPDVNFRLAKHLHTAGVPVLWFVSPQLWAWKKRRLAWVRRRVDRMMVIFPFEEPFYRNRSVAATFTGHPLAELPLPTISREDYAERYALDPAKPWIALLPGSRWKEVRANLPAMHELAARDLIQSAAARTIYSGDQLTPPADPTPHTRYEFLLPVASTIDRTRLTALLDELTRSHLRYATSEGTPPPPVRITLVDDAREALLHARASVVASGTATVQAATIGNPFVVVYRVSPLTYALAKRLVSYPDDIPHALDRDGNVPVAMVNLIAGRRIVPELLQHRFTASNLAEELALLLDDTPQRAQQLAALAEVRAQLHAPSGSAIDQVVTAALKLLNQPATLS